MSLLEPRQRSLWPKGRMQQGLVIISLLCLLGLLLGHRTSLQSIKAIHSRPYAFSPSSLTKIFPPPDLSRKNHRELNDLALRELHACIARDDCGENQRKVALLASHWFPQAIVEGWRGGEGVWGISIYNNLRKLGYTTILAKDWEEALYLYRMMPDLIKIVVKQLAGECQRDPECVKSPQNPTGIPAWKIFDFEFFPTQKTSVLKGPWTVSADVDDFPELQIQYLGYSIEESCSKYDVVPSSQRHNRAWIYGKELSYFYHDLFPWDFSYPSRVSAQLDITFTGGWNNDSFVRPELPGPFGPIPDVENLGKLGVDEFYNQLRMSKVVIGIGSPWWSPTPYDALCLGVPFINPIFYWSKEDPADRKKWFSQHPSLRYADPPYVYNVKARDFDELLSAIRSAIANPIDRYIFPRMTDSAVQLRLVKLMETDWRTLAMALLEERMVNGGEVFEI